MPKCGQAPEERVGRSTVRRSENGCPPGNWGSQQPQVGPANSRGKLILYAPGSGGQPAAGRRATALFPLGFVKASRAQSAAGGPAMPEAEDLARASLAALLRASLIVRPAAMPSRLPPMETATTHFLSAAEPDSSSTW